METLKHTVAYQSLISVQRLGTSKQPYTSRSLFGWVVRGPIGHSKLEELNINTIQANMIVHEKNDNNQPRNTADGNKAIEATFGCLDKADGRQQVSLRLIDTKSDLLDNSIVKMGCLLEGVHMERAINDICSDPMENHNERSKLAIPFTDSVSHSEFKFADCKCSEFLSKRRCTYSVTNNKSCVGTQRYQAKKISEVYSELTLTTDSFVVLRYAGDVTDRFANVITNRIGQPPKLHRIDRWRHVNSNVKHSLLASRGLNSNFEKFVTGFVRPSIFANPECDWCFANTWVLSLKRYEKLKRNVYVNIYTFEATRLGSLDNQQHAWFVYLSIVWVIKYLTRRLSLRERRRQLRLNVVFVMNDDIATVQLITMERNDVSLIADVEARDSYKLPNVKKLNSIFEQTVMYLGGIIRSTHQPLSMLSNNKRILEFLTKKFFGNFCRSTSIMGFCINDIGVQDSHSRCWQQAHNQVVLSWKRKTDFSWILLSYHGLVTSDRNIILNALLKFETPRGCWLKGINNPVHTRPDGLIRQVLVETNSGLVKRDLRSLCLLEGVLE